MSDFVRIMRGWGNYCSGYDDCQRCPLCQMCVHSSPLRRTHSDIAKIEQVVENWLKDHPLPSTPTWIKWLSENGIIDSIEDGNVKLLPLAYYPMDEEIAAKLGELENG